MFMIMKRNYLRRVGIPVLLCAWLSGWLIPENLVAQVKPVIAEEQKQGPETAPDAGKVLWAIAIHGGAGNHVRGTLTGNREEDYRKALEEALEIGSAILGKGGNSIDAVEAVIRFMEDNPLFNAGKGAVLNSEGKAELDASIMDGKTGLAGAVAGVTTIKNPVTAARKVMDRSPHVLLIGSGAEAFAKKNDLEMVDPSYFITPDRLAAWERWKQKVSPEEAGQDQDLQGSEKNPEPLPGTDQKKKEVIQKGSLKEKKEEKKKDLPTEKAEHGTVGAVALDRSGNLAAATSTGGMMGKMAGRVGDSPLIGAGTFADNNTCAVSGTGHGEFFIRNLVSYDISALMEYRGMPLEEAARYVVMEKLTEKEGTGGVIAVDRAGNIAMPFNTESMFRGFRKSSGESKIEIYR